MLCQNCGAQVPESAKACANCGVPCPEAAMPAGATRPREERAFNPRDFAIFAGGFIALCTVMWYLSYRGVFHVAFVSPPSPSPSTTGIGETVTVRQSNGFWPCGSTTEALDELTKWAVRGDSAEVRRTLFKTRSIGIDGGMKVKILDTRGFLIQQRKVRVLTNSAGEAYGRDEQGQFPADPRIGHECWVDSQALTR